PGSSTVLMTDSGAQAKTPLGQWQADFIDPTTGDAAPPAGRAGEADLDGFRVGLVAGLVPGIALGWSWPDMLRHAVALAAAASFDGAVDLDAYESLLPEVSTVTIGVSSGPARASVPGQP
ncbi:MAG: hypothetical protein J2P29_00755, partial [Actinobacteria bacterium]|nr:hypothetical protein [Actinomycetota bacterium]